MSDDTQTSENIRIAIRRLRDRIFAFIEPLTAVMNADATLTAHVQPTWDQAMVPFLTEWKQLWEDGSQWTWPSLDYFTKRWNSVSDRVGQILPYALRKQLQPVAVGGAQRERGRGEYGRQHSDARPLIGSQSVSAFNRLSNIVAQHENFWGRVAQHSYGHNAAVMKAWLHTAWDPWFTAFGNAVGVSGGVMDDSTATTFAHSLTALRQLAKSPAWLVPVPAIDSSDGDSVLIGAIVHLPNEIEDELDLVNSEIMAFDQEAQVWNQSLAAQVNKDPEILALHAAEDAADKELQRLKQAPSKKDAHNVFLHDPQQLAAIQAASKTAHDTRLNAGTAFEQHLQKLASWYNGTWTPFLETWREFYDHKKNVPAQMWPGSGSWDHIQDQAQKLIDIRAAAPFKSTAPAPIAARRDQDILGNLGDLLKSAGSVAKYAIIGVLAIGGIVALSSVVSNVRKGKDPAENYMKLIGTRRQRSPRKPPGERPAKPPRLPSAPRVLQLPAGEISG